MGNLRFGREKRKRLKKAINEHRTFLKELAHIRRRPGKNVRRRLKSATLEQEAVLASVLKAVSCNLIPINAETRAKLGVDLCKELDRYLLDSRAKWRSKQARKKFLRKAATYVPVMLREIFT